MKKSIFLSRRLLLQTSVVLLSLVLFSAGLTISGEGAQPMRIDSVELSGLTGSANNMAFVYERYVIVAPYAPKSPVTEDSTLEDFDNHFLYLIDTKRPELGIQKTDIKCYYPTKLIYDPGTGVAFVRGTRYEPIGNKYEPVEVVAHVRINLDDNGKPVFGNAITFDVKGIDSERANDALPDLGLGQRGSVLVFANGASVYTFTLKEGYIYHLPLIALRDYSENHSISYLGVDEATNTLVISVNNREEQEDGSIKESSTLRFYELREDGTVDLRKILTPASFPEGTAIVAGSNVAIVPGATANEAGFVVPASAYFVTNDGSLCQVELTGSIDGIVKRIETIPALAQANPTHSSPRFLKFDAQKKVLTILKRGNVSEIRRPFYGRPGRPGSIRRPFYARVEETPALVFAQFSGKKNLKLSEIKVFEGEFEAGDALSTITVGQGAAPAFATYSGRLFSVHMTGGVGEAALIDVGQIGERIDSVAYNSQRNSYVSITSFRTNEEGTEIEQPGALSVARLINNGTLSATPGLFESLMSVGSMITHAAPSIRRPVNIGRPTR